MRTHGAVVGRRFRSVTKLTTKVRIGRGYLWGSFLIAAAALKTPTRNGYNAQGVNFKIFWYYDATFLLDGELGLTLILTLTLTLTFLLDGELGLTLILTLTLTLTLTLALSLTLTLAPTLTLILTLALTLTLTPTLTLTLTLILTLSLSLTLALC